MPSDYTKLPQAKPRVGETADKPALAPSRQAVMWDIEARQFYAADNVRQWMPINPVYSIAAFSNPPTAAELTAEFGSPATIGPNFSVIINNNDASTNVYYVVSTASDWWVTTMTKAV